ncbi:Phosphopantetheine attachment site [Paenibacillus algorifonticola]|uniref:Phosphopantetheine attachment site n=1 Tax=Paenibacillus algorifonticola TaxID=684063 RepID=A0A1I2IBN5_9BACL|nr:acyl carrier protein [Paenibacillus algorifonticola]SFF39705.1 Phosphopantetheine attachment site [Paenibacillus algorifonticola]
MNRTEWNKEHIEGYVLSQVKEQLQLQEDVAPDYELASYGMDSFASMNLVVAFETNFNIVFEDEELLFENFATVQDMVDRIYGKLQP